MHLAGALFTRPGDISMTIIAKGPLPADNERAADYVGDCYSFNEFQLWPRSRVLIRSGATVPIGGRALDILIALVERAGQIVSKAELFNLVWPNRFIEESNLRVNIAALRKALSEHRSDTRLIASVPGRGYSFVAEIIRTTRRTKNTEAEINAEAERRTTSITSRNHAGFPAALTRIFGRDEFVTKIADQLPWKRLITITGTGGIGKTAVALAIAARVANAYRDGVQIINLAPLTHPDLLAAHIASMLRLPALDDKEPLEKIQNYLRPRAQLIYSTIANM